MRAQRITFTPAQLRYMATCMQVFQQLPPVGPETDDLQILVSFWIDGRMVAMMDDEEGCWLVEVPNS